MSTRTDVSPTSTPPPPWPLLRGPAWVLIASLPIFVVYMVTGALSMPTKRAAELTRDQLRDVTASWITINLLWAAAFLCGAVGIVLISRRLASVSRSNGWSRTSGYLAAAGGAVFIVYAVSQVVVLGTGAPTLGDDPLHAANTYLSVTASWLLLLATGFLALGLRRAGVVGVAGIVFAVIAFVYLLVDAASWLPAFTGNVAPADAGALPPALSGVLWCALGVVLVRRRVSSGL